MDLKRSRLVTYVVALLFLMARHANAQRHYPPLEFQIGAQLPTRPLVSHPNAHVQRGTGTSFGVLLYSYPGNPLGFRMRADLVMASVETATPEWRGSDDRKEFSLGADLVPHALRVVVRDVEARFYTGVGLRLSLGWGGDDVTVTGSNRYWTLDQLPEGTGVDVVGRLGWFIRRASRPSPLRFDVSYQLGEVSGIVQHDLAFRIGVGGTGGR